MSIEYFLPKIRERLQELFKEKKISEKMNIEEINALLTKDINKKKKFLVLTNPDIYLDCIYDFMATAGAGSITTLTAWYYLFFHEGPAEEGPQESAVRKNISRRLMVCRAFGLVGVEMLDYTYPKMVTIYKVYNCTEEQRMDAIESYAGFEKGYRERMEVKRRKDYYHHTDKEKDKDKKELDTEILVKKAVERKIKKTVEKDIEALTTEKYHCCNKNFKTEKELEEHWKEKYFPAKEGINYPEIKNIKGEIIKAGISYPKGTLICKECYNAYRTCKHNCEKKYYTEKERIKTELEALSKQREMEMEKGRLLV